MLAASTNLEAIEEREETIVRMKPQLRPREIMEIFQRPLFHGEIRFDALVRGFDALVAQPEGDHREVGA